MAHYSPITQDGFCASIAVHKEATGRWQAGVHVAPVDPHAKGVAVIQRKVANDFPDEAQAVLAAYALGRDLIAQAQG